MENLGGFISEEERKTEKAENTEIKTVSLDEARKKRRAFHYWTVNGRDYRLKLKASAVGKLETKYRKNITSLVEELPPLSIMLTILLAAMEPWEHGMDYTDIQKLYDVWTEEGGNQIDLYSKVVIPTLAVSGFFTAKQAAAILEETN